VKLLVAVLVALVLAPAAAAGGPTMLVGAAEDAVKQPTLAEAKAKLDLLKLAGFNAVRVTSLWNPALDAPLPLEIAQYQALADAAEMDGIRVFVSVYPFGSSVTPLTPEAQDQFARYAAALAKAVPKLRDFIIGNEPNLNRFWLPQFGPSGEDVAAPAFLGMLARTYDALKAVDPTLRVLGVALSPRGVDKPDTGRDTHSPTAFIRDLGAAYRASGRTIPVMDAFAFHPYPDTNATPPTATHPNSSSIGLADYGKLRSLLGEAFDGTGQPGSTLPILYTEFGVEALIPAAKASLYTGREPTTVQPVDEATQASYYAQAIALAFCQPTVDGIFLFHAIDESDLDRFQSGVFYADGSPKSSLAAVQKAIRGVRGGTIARCDGLTLTPQGTIASPAPTALKAGRASVALTCTIDCNYYVRLERLPNHSTTLAVSGRAVAGTATRVALPTRRVAPGRYRVTARLTAPTNVGPPAVVTGPTLVVR
jgi:hypothetical protein